MVTNDTLGAVIDVRAARFVLIHDAWVGYNHHAPIVATYELHRGARGDLTGAGRFSTAVVAMRVVPVSIPPAAAARFLGAVADARLVEGPYEARREWTDDYPHVELVFHCDFRKMGRQQGIALLYTESQGEFNAPWGACVGGELWTIRGAEVGRALHALRRPLKRAVLDRMMNDGEQRGDT